MDKVLRVYGIGGQGSGGTVFGHGIGHGNGEKGSWHGIEGTVLWTKY